MHYESTLFYFVFGIATIVCNAETQSTFFDLDVGVNTLRDAINNFSTYQKIIIDVLSKISFGQRYQIEAEYRARYGRDLINDIDNKLSREVVELIIAMTTPSSDHTAKELYNAFLDPENADEIIIDVVNMVRNCENYAHVAKSYETLFNKSLISDLESHPSESFRSFLLPVFKGDCNQVGDVNPAWAIVDARNLLETSALVPLFSEIFRHRSKCQLREIFLEYDRRSERGIKDAITDETSGSIQKLLLAIVENTMSREHHYFVRRLHESVERAKLDHRTITRIFVGEFYKFAEILTKFEERYGKFLEICASKDPSSHYAYALKSCFYNKRTPDQKKRNQRRKD